MSHEYVLVPLEPTAEMLVAGLSNTDAGDEFPSTHCITEVYKAMVRAAALNQPRTMIDEYGYRVPVK